jgi:hypothetical protein
MSGLKPIPNDKLLLTEPSTDYGSVPVAARCKAWVCGRSPAEIVD